MDRPRTTARTMVELSDSIANRLYEATRRTGETKRVIIERALENELDRMEKETND